MRVTIARLPRFTALRHVLLVACGVLTLAGCSSWRQTQPAAAVSTAPAAIESDANRAAAVANAGAQTSSVTKLQKFFWVFSPYRPDIQQGNFVSQEMLAQLKVGQTRDQVKFILGTPLLTDAFHAERWDYPFYLARGNGELTKARVTVYFKDDKVERFDGGNLPTEREYIARIAGPAKVAAKAAPKKEEAGSATIQVTK
ncbi:outer membrane protein assembly factor BamE [Massilia sp. PWRC2]|uniref:outer membrane protein assembly factor BamE n=1 Tax=Massilia sp. PWRC2 TaxID=2804626 RepID=UPI003CEF537E